MKTKHRKKEQVTKKGETFSAVTQNKVLWELSAKTLLNVNILIRGPEQHG